MKLVEMLKKSLIAGSSLLLLVIGFQVHAACKEDLESRIAPVGMACVEGEECKEAVAEVAEAPKAARSGSEITADYCAGCHATGVMNAPKIGSSFKDLGARGIDDLLASAKKGKNAMPPKGGCGDCSNDELKASIQHMLDQ